MVLRDPFVHFNSDPGVLLVKELFHMSRLSTKFDEAINTSSTPKIIDNVEEQYNTSVCRPKGWPDLTNGLPENATLPAPLSHMRRKYCDESF